MVALLLEARVSVTAVNTDGVTALHDAVTRGDADIVTLLLAAGADTAAVATRGKLKGKSPRDLAADSEQLRHLFPELEPASPPTVTMNGDHHQNGDGDSAADSEDTAPAPAPAAKTRPAPAPAPQQLTEPQLGLLWPRPRHLAELGGAGVVVGPLLQLVVTQHPHTSVHTVVEVWELYTEVGTVLVLLQILVILPCAGPRGYRLQPRPPCSAVPGPMQPGAGRHRGRYRGQLFSVV